MKIKFTAGVFLFMLYKPNNSSIGIVMIINYEIPQP